MWMLLVACAPEGVETDPAAGTTTCAALAPWLPDADGDGYGDDASMRLSCTAPEGWIQVEGDCDDADPSVHTGHPDVCGDGVDADCDGVDPADRTERPWGAEDAGWILRGDDPSEKLGWSVVGMVAYDGADQVVVGAPGNAAVPGHIEVASGWVLGNAVQMAPEESVPGDGFGYALAVGDLTGDGAPDAAVGAPGPEVGAVWILDGAEGRLSLGLRGDPAGSSLGARLAAGRDATGDGIPDLLAGAVFSDEGKGSGGAWLVAGPLGGAAEVASVGVPVASPTPGDGGGSGLDFVDGDGDGVAEVLLGAPETEVDGVIVGAVHLLRPGDPTPTASVWGTEPDANFGYAVSGLGDYTGDGYDDVAVGEPSYTVGEDNLGAAFVFAGPFAGDRALPDAVLTVRGETSLDYVGYAVDGEDLTGDGLPDLLVSGLAATVDRSDTGAGAVLAFTCGATGQRGPSDPSLAWFGEGAVTFFGWSFSTVADGDEDGFPDLVVGAPYRATDDGVVVGAAYVMRR